MTGVMRDNPPTPSADALANMSEIKDMAEGLHKFLCCMPQGREMALAKTNLEQAVMWAVKGLAIADEGSSPNGDAESKA